MRIESILTGRYSLRPGVEPDGGNFDGWCESWNVEATDIRASKSIEERKATRRPQRPETGPLMKRNALRGH